MALRAQQFMTLNQRLAARALHDEAEVAARRHSMLEADLRGLLCMWTQRRAAGQLDAQADAAFQRFHEHQQVGIRAALNSKCERQGAFERAQNQLKRSFGTEQVLQRLAEQVAQRARVEQQARELQSMGEAWLLGRAATGSES
jgi:hypothetical protein